MNLVVKIVISLVVAGAAWALHEFAPTLHVAVVLAVATVITALLVSVPAATGSGDTGAQVQAGYAPAADTTPASGARGEGEVKWFNVSKGFGFITKDNGEEIFVHFRSIRGEGRRGLREGQRVSFVEARTEKGPQAEDVEALSS